MGTLDTIYNDVVHTYTAIEETKNSPHLKDKLAQAKKNHQSNHSKHSSNNSNTQFENSTLVLLQELKRDNETFKQKFCTIENTNERLLEDNMELQKQLIEQNSLMLTLQREMLEMKKLIKQNQEEKSLREKETKPIIQNILPKKIINLKGLSSKEAPYVEKKPSCDSNKNSTDVSQNHIHLDEKTNIKASSPLSADLLSNEEHVHLDDHYEQEIIESPERQDLQNSGKFHF